MPPAHLKSNPRYFMKRPPMSEITQLFQELPFLSPLYTPYEKSFDAEPLQSWSLSVWPVVPVSIVAAYLVVVLLARWAMSVRSPLGGRGIRRFLACWNLCLASFSVLGALRTAPHLAFSIWSMGYERFLCDPVEKYNWGLFSTGLWVQLFIFSKPLELGDTLFIVALKRPLSFLHVYHHITVLLFCWHSYAFESPAGLFFVAMNYSVHFVMYLYFFLMCEHIKPKWFKAGEFAHPRVLLSLVLSLTHCDN